MTEKMSRELKLQGWRVLVIWECKTKNVGALDRLLIKFLGG